MKESSQRSRSSLNGGMLDGDADKYKAPPVSAVSDTSLYGPVGDLAHSSRSDDSLPLKAPARDGVTLSVEEQEAMFRALRHVFERAEEDLGSFDIQDLLNSLDAADSDARRGHQNLEALHEVKVTLDQLWRSNSSYMAQATELLANGSRNPKWRLPYGSCGILDFYLRIVATPDVDKDVMLHSLRLVGNSCADIDENRQIVVEKNYTSSIINLFSNSDLVHVAIPVIYNICADFEPAQAQAASNGIVDVLLRQLSGGSIQGEALLTCAYELVEMGSEQARTVDHLSVDSFRLVFPLAEESEREISHFVSISNALLALLQSERFQRACITDRSVENVLSILQRSYQFASSDISEDEEASLVQLRLKANQALSDISALPEFPVEFPLSSPLINTLLKWLEKTREDQLQICACVVLGNIAREDRICEALVRDFKVHVRLVSVLNSDAKGSVLHAALGFLKNLAIPQGNREFLGNAGLIKAISRLWAFDSIPQVQFLAVSLTRQAVASSTTNIGHLLEPLSPDPDSPANSRTYLSLLLALFSKSDSSPIRTEIGRTIATISRSILRVGEQGIVSGDAAALAQNFFGLHEDVARPVGAMITQTEWPVVRSEGWFALALMASSELGSEAAADCIENMSVTGLLSDTVRMVPPEKNDGEHAQAATERSMKTKDRDNVLILMHGLLKNSPPGLSQTQRDLLDDLTRSVSSSAST